MAWELLWLLLTSSSACPTVSCVSDMSAKECFRQDTDRGTIELQSCERGMVCEFNQMESMEAYDFQARELSCVQPDRLQKYPGEVCDISEECLSRNCTGTCQGLPQFSPCADFSNCAPGLVCWNGFCIAQITLGGACTASWQCVNNALCAQGHCVRFFSQPLGQTITDTSQVCESGYEAQGICANPPRNMKKPDEQCYKSDDCPLSSGENGECWCGFNTAEMAFCVSKPGDEEFSMLKNALLATIDASIECHTNTSLTPRCSQLAKSATFRAYQTALYIYYYRPVIIAAPECILEVMPFARNYSYAYSSVQPTDVSIDSVTVIAVVAAVLLTFICIGVISFLCVRRYLKQNSREMTIQSRIRNNELLIIKVCMGQVPNPPPAPLQAKFTFTDLQLSEYDGRYLKVGIPVTLPVQEQADLEEVQLGLPRLEKPRFSIEETLPSPHSAKVRPSF